jgi:hypothetical protein
MAKTQYLEYTIYLPDKERIAELQAQYPNGIRLAPATASTTYEAPMQVATEDFASPGIRSPLFILPYLTSGLVNFPRNQDTFTRKTGGWFGLSFLFGNTTTYIWVGKFAYAPDATAEIGGEPQEVVAIAKRKWIIGFETPNASGDMAEMANTGGNSNRISRVASRHPDGFGLFQTNNMEFTATPTQSGDAASSQVWERFYFRMTNEPNGTTRMWRLKCTIGANRGCSINMTIDRRLVVHNINDAGVETQFATSSRQFDLDTWYRLDILVNIAAVGGTIAVYVNRSIEINATAPAAAGISTASTHETSHLGAGSSGAGTNTFQCHYDDWIASAWPTEDSDGDYVGLDWLNGSRVKLIPATAFAAGNDWAGDYRYANQISVPSIDSGIELTSSTSGHNLRLLMDTVAIKAVEGAIGVVAFLVAAYGRTLVAGQGTLGWKYDGTTDLAAQVTFPGGTIEGGNTYRWYRRWHRPAGATDPIADLTPIEVHKVKSLDAQAADYLAVHLIVELIGTFGEEDVPESADEPDEPLPLPPRRGLHNAPYPTTRWGRSSLPPQSPVVIHSGTYVGNGTVTELTFRTNVNWIMIQRVTGGSTLGQGGFWWSSMVGGHVDGEPGHQAGMPSEALPDPAYAPANTEDTQEQRIVLRLVGNDNKFNANTVTYQYVAFMDPGRRYHLNDQYQVASTAFTPVGSKVVEFPSHSTFLPEWGFYHEEVPGGTGGVYNRVVKGPGHATDAANNMDGTAVASAVRHDVAGQITVLPGMMDSDTRTRPFSLWRDDDGSDDPNKHYVLKIGSYVGDGAASRTINFGTSGKRPLYAIVQPGNAAAIHRTPANTGTNSDPMNGGATTTTGITAGGIDSFTVGATLNANAVTYNYFVLIGSATAGNGGWSIDGEFSVVEPDWPGDGDYDDPEDSEEPEPEEPVDPEDPVEPPDDDDDCDEGSYCVVATTRIVNLALIEIGVLKVLDNYCTQDTDEAVLAREVYEQCVRHTLITYPWPFATKYAVLSLTATQPSNQDWAYSYRMPSDCVFPRRIVTARGTAVDPSPPPMGLSSDGSGGIILCNEANATLEYTARPACVGFNGDDLFREALKWRVAAALAPPLTRIAGEAERCLKMFEIIVQKAESVVKQGVPGLRSGASTLDTTAAALAANVQVVNRALVRIGARTITNLTTEQSREAVAANLIFEDELRSVLRDHPWAFATRYVDPLTLVDGEEGDPVNVDWTFSHRLPTDFVFLRRLALEGTGRSFEAEPFPYRLGSDETGGLLFSNQEEPIVEYTARLQNIMVYADPVFRDALAWRIAASLAPSLANVELHRPEQHGRGPETPQDPTRRQAMRNNDQQRRINIAQWAWAMYERALMDAKVADRNEAQPEPHADADWIRARE